jgi:dephospho-CoA kinase
MIQRNRKFVVGLTGGIACGKSTALGQFEKLGWSVLSADNVASEILKNDAGVRLKITQRWGVHLLDDRGSIDKTALARIVFSKESERSWVGGLLHPIIRSKWISFVQSCPSHKCMIELPLLFENNLQSRFNCTLSTFAPITMMLKRIYARGLSHADAEARVESQWSVSKKTDLADYVVWGGGSQEFLKQQVLSLDLTLSHLFNL